MVARPQSDEEKEGGEGQDGLLGESVPTKEDRERGMVPGTRGCVVSRTCACVCVCVCVRMCVRVYVCLCYVCFAYGCVYLFGRAELPSMTHALIPFTS